ncbi:MYG1 exonuclease-like isoform X2 [Hylaeus volcanicus]|nr:MYG1 exonuclease-like isoform X2 [Hylaeus volcanicus]
MEAAQPLIVLPTDVVGSIENRTSSNQKFIVTHNGRFHCDDVCAVGFLLLLPEYKNCIVVRTRDEEIIEKADVVVDVGGVYDAENYRFDHHQKGFSEYFNSTCNVTKLSSFGQVYKFFGKRLLREIFSIPEEDVNIIYNLLYKSFVEAIDAIDNGVNITPPGVDPLYRISTDLSSRVARMNSSWNDWNPDDFISKEAFISSIRIAMEDFIFSILSYRDNWLPCKNIVYNAYKARFETHPSGYIIALELGCPFETHLEIIEESEKRKNEENKNQEQETFKPFIPVFFVVYPDCPKKNT